MSVRFRCTHCQKPLEVDDPEVGKDVLCYYCRQPVRVPEQSDPALGAPSTPPPIRRSPVLGVIGLVAGLGVVAGFLFILIWGFNQMVPLIRTPEFAAASPARQQELANQKMAEIQSHPIMTRGPWLILGLSLLAIIFSIAGLVKHSGRGAAIAGLVLGGIFLLIQIAALLRALLAAGKPGG